MAALTEEQKATRAANKVARLASAEVAREAREAQYAAEEATRLAAMPMTLLALMARSEAVSLDYRVYASPELSVEFRDKYGDPTRLVLTSSEEDVRQVEYDIESKEFEVEEARKKEERRQAALAKLSDEDRKALGI